MRSAHMLRSFRRYVLFVACLCLLNVRGSCTELPDTEIASRIEGYVGRFAASGNFSGSVLVARKGRVLVRKAWGMASYELRVPNSPGTRFHIASVSKPFTAAAILQLQEQGRLKLSDTVKQYVPDFPNGDRITLNNLLTHTSGIPNVNDLPDYDTFARTPHTPQELVAKFAGLPLEFQPGSDYHYSNSNYNLLALILEKVTGESYGAYLSKRIFGPLAMSATGHHGDARELIPLAASGYEPAGINGYEPAPYLDWSNKTGNGSLYSTLDDLYRFDRALNNDSLLKASTRQEYFVPGRGNRYGWFIRNRGEHRVMSSNGRSPGFTAEFDRYPDEDVTVIVLSNSYASVSQDPIAEAIGGIVFGEAPQPPEIRAASIEDGTLKAYAGEYQFGPDYFVANAKATIVAAEGYLLLTVGDFRTPLVPLSRIEFLERNFFGHVSITTNGASQITGLKYRYANKEFVAHRAQGK